MIRQHMVLLQRQAFCAECRENERAFLFIGEKKFAEMNVKAYSSYIEYHTFRYLAIEMAEILCYKSIYFRSADSALLNVEKEQKS